MHVRRICLETAGTARADDVMLIVGVQVKTSEHRTDPRIQREGAEN